MSFLDLWPAFLLIAATLSSGVICGFVVADALTLRDMRRAGTDRQPAATPEEHP